LYKIAPVKQFVAWPPAGLNTALRFVALNFIRSSTVPVEFDVSLTIGIVGAISGCYRDTGIPQWKDELLSEASK
jgi:hypothetical protein